MGKRRYSYRYGLGILLLACCFLHARPLCALASDGSVVRPDNFEEFTDAVINMIDNNSPVESSGTGSEDIFCNKRLIVKAKSAGLDLKKYNPSSVVEAGPLYILQFSTCREAETAMKQLQASGDVEYAEPDSDIKGVAGDAGAGKHNSWGVSAIGADRLAANLASSRTQEIKVAVIDSGVASHPALDGRVVSGYDFVDNDENPEDLNEHGTHVSGIIVDCTPGLNVKILPVRVLDERGRGLSLTAGLGVRYAADHGASVINLSLCGRHNNFMDENIAYAIEKGVTVVVAAGNNGEDTALFCPAHINDAIVVGAVDSRLKVASFSNKGNSLDVVAPGVSINGPVLGGQYDSLSGTSMAAPHVAAIAAMYKLQDPSRTPAKIEALIKSKAKDLGPAGWDSAYGYGLAEAYKTVEPVGITMNRASLFLVIGKSITLKPKVNPKGATRMLAWKSSDKKIAAVKDGRVTAKKEGRATITVTTDNGKKATCKVEVIARREPPAKVTLNTTKLFLQVGSDVTLEAAVSPKSAVKKLSWRSSNTKVAAVKNGKVSAKKVGSATITVTTKNGKKAICEVTVTKKKGKKAQALENYRNMLIQNKKYRYFSVCYINEDDIPDLMALTRKNSSNYVYYINGRKAADLTMVMMMAGDPELDELTYYYYPKRNLVMYRYKDAIPDVYYWEDYCTFAPCSQNGYSHALMEVLTKSWGASDEAAEYGYYCFSDASVPEAQYDEMLENWVLGRDVTGKEFNTVLAGITKKTKRQEMKFVENTAANRKKYLSR